MQAEEDQGMATGNMYKNLVKFSHVVYELCEWTNKQTHRQTNILITILQQSKYDTLVE